MSYQSYENPMVIGAEVKGCECPLCGSPVEEESEYTDSFGRPICLRCGFWEEEE